MVRHTGSTARAAVRMAMSIFATCFPRLLLIDSPFLFRDGQERPGHQASAPYVATGCSLLQYLDAFLLLEITLFIKLFFE